MANKIEAVFFDFGGVFTHSPINALMDYAVRMKVDPMKLGGLVFGDYGNDTDHSWHKLERGEITFKQAEEQIVADAKQEGITLKLAEVFESMGTSAEDLVRHDFVDKARQLSREGYKLAIITNNIAEYSDGWRGLFDVESIFPEIIDSSREKMRKPNPDIYRLAMKRVGTVPERSVFLDDYDSNVRAAEQLGMRAVLVTDDSAATFAQLDAILGGKD